MANEKRLIDANELVPYLWALFRYFGSLPCSEADKATQRAIKRCIGEVKKMPTVDSVEVVHGKWEKAEYNGFLRCDQCKDVYINEEWLADGKWNYCPNCGADMRGSEE